MRSPSESKSKLGAIFSASAIPISVKTSNGIKSLELVSANEPKFQNEMDRASARVIAVVSNPTIAEIVAETDRPIMTKLRGERFRSSVAKRSVTSVASNAPTAAIAIAPTDPIITTFASTPITTANAAPAEVPKIAGSANGLFVAPCASAPATPRAAPTISAVTIRGIRICQRIWLAPEFAFGCKSAVNKPSIWLAPTLSATKTIAVRRARFKVRNKLRWRFTLRSRKRKLISPAKWGF